MKQTKLHSAQLVDIKVPIYPFFLNKKTQMTMGAGWEKRKRKNHTTRLSPLSFFPVSLRYETISGHTPMMLLTTSRRPGRERSPVSMARRRDCLDCIQSRCSAPFSLTTMNSVIEKGSNVPNTTDLTGRQHKALPQFFY